MTKRLGCFLAVAFTGVVLLLAGLTWDAVLHANDPALAGREGIFAWRNPGHVLLGTGMGTVVVGLVGAVDAALSLAGNRRWDRPAVRRAFAAGSTALVVAAAAISSWSATTDHDQGLAGPHPRQSGHAGGLVAPGDHAEAALAAPIAAHQQPGEAGVVAHDHVRPSGGPGEAPRHEPAAHDHAATAPVLTHPLPAAATLAHADTPRAPQGGDHDHDSAPPPAPENPPAGEVTEVRYGPFVLAPAGAGGDLDHANVVIPEAPKPCEDCFILGAEPDLVYPDGSSANLDTGVMLHHAVFFNSGRPDTTCGNDEFFGGLGERFLASGNERTKKRIPEGFGYYLGTSPVNAIFHVMNHSSTPKTVYFTYKVRWVPGSAASIRPVIPVWLDMNNCRTSEYEVPAGPNSQHWQWKSTITGRIVATGGHVHTGGIRTTLSNATTGRHVCTSWAGYGTKPAYMGSVESMGVCAWDSLGTVRAGEVLDLEAVYDAPAPVDDAMGIMVAMVYETPDLDGGTPPPPEVTGNTPAPPTSTPPESGHHPHH